MKKLLTVGLILSLSIGSAQAYKPAKAAGMNELSGLPFERPGRRIGITMPVDPAGMSLGLVDVPQGATKKLQAEAKKLNKQIEKFNQKISTPNLPQKKLQDLQEQRAKLQQQRMDLVKKFRHQAGLASTQM